MDYRKIDASLGEVLAEAANTDEPNLVVFISTTEEPNADQASLLQSIGVNQVAPGRRVFTGTLSVHAIDQLTDQPWVRSVKLSQKLRPS
jgi:hypothetical protein